MTGMVPTVFIVDDDPSVLKALARLMRSAGLNAVTFAAPQDFLDHYDQNAPGCLVLDVAMPHINGLELQQTLVSSGSELPIIFLTGHGDIPMSVRAIKQGAFDFLTKPVHDSDLIEAIHDAIEKDRIARQARDKSNELQQRLATLTPREREVLVRVVSGKKNRQIADELGTVEKTIKVHRAHLMIKLKAGSLAAGRTVRGYIFAAGLNNVCFEQCQGRAARAFFTAWGYTSSLNLTPCQSGTYGPCRTRTCCSRFA